MAKETVMPNGRPWYVKTLELILNKEGFLAVVVVLMGTMFYVNQRADRQDRSADNELRREQNKVLVDVLTTTAKRNADAVENQVSSAEAMQTAIEDLAEKAAIMEEVPLQRQQHHDESMQLMTDLIASSQRLEENVLDPETAEALKGFKEVKEEHKATVESHKNLEAGQLELKNGQKEILEAIANPSP
jgi:hypothetical protein